MATKLTVDCSTGEVTSVEMTGVEQAAYDLLRASTPIQKSAILQVTAEDFRTTDAVQATLKSWPLSPLTLYRGRFTVLAADVATGVASTWEARASAKRLNAGALLVGTPVIDPPIQNAGAAAWGLTFDVSGNNVRARVTGVAGVTISWNIVGEIIRARSDGLVD